MIFDCRKWNLNFNEGRWRIFVDGVQVLKVFYADTERGEVQTYDVLGDGKVHTARELARLGIDGDPSWHIEPGPEWSTADGFPVDGVMAKTIRGKVELLPFVEASEIEPK